MSFKRAGPFPVVKRIRSSAYELKIPQMWKSLHPVINESKLKSYYHPTLPQQEISLTIIAPSQESITQEKISDFRRQGNELQYFIKWQEQPFEESMWEDRQEVIKGGLCRELHKRWLPAIPMPQNSIWMPEKLYNEDVGHVRPYLE